METEINNIDTLVKIFTKKEKEFEKERDFFKRIVASEIYNMLTKKLVLNPADRFYLAAYNIPVVSISREGMALRGRSTKLPFDWIRSLETHRLMHIFILVRSAYLEREEARKKREEEIFKKKTEVKAKAQRKKDKKLAR